LLYPVFFFATTQLAVTKVQEIKGEDLIVAVVGSDLPEELLSFVEEDDHLRFESLPGPVASSRLADGEVAAVLMLPPELMSTLAEEQGVDIALEFDSTRETSERAKKQVERLLISWRDALVATRLKTKKLAPQFIEPFQVEAQNIAPPVKVGGHLLGSIVPMLVVLMIGLGAFHPAVEVTAGEKERGTLQTLLTAPVLPLEIVAGKFVGVLLVALLAGASNLLSIGLLGGLAAFSPLPEDITQNVSLALSFGQVLSLIWITLLIALFFSALMMTVAVLARTYREAQAYTTPIYFLCVLPAMFAQLPGMDANGPLAMVPGIGQALVMKAVLNGTITMDILLRVTVATLLFTGGILVVAAKIFETESVLLGEVGLTGVLRRTRRAGGGVPRPSDALAFAAVIAVFYLYLGSALQLPGAVAGESDGLLIGLTLSQWLILGLPCIVWLRSQRYDIKASLGLRRPPLVYILAATCLGLTAWYPASLLASIFSSPGSDEAARQMASQLFPADSSFIWVFFVVAITPAVCEELLVRGVLLRAFQTRFRARTVALITGVMFGAFHLSFAKFLPLTILGILIGWFAIRSASILPGVLFHLLNNGMAVVLSLYPPDLLGLRPEDGFHWLPALVSTLGIAIGLWLLFRSPNRLTDLPRSN
jgi:sodium transport system permease protein